MMRETKIFNVPVRTVEEILPEVFEFIQEKFREFVDERNKGRRLFELEEAWLCGNSHRK